MIKWIFFSLILCLVSCSPVKPSVDNEYKLDAYSDKKLYKNGRRHSILITAPQAVAGYQTEQMMYVRTPFSLNPFAHSAWISPPADMLYPLIIQSIQQTGYFYAVTSNPTAEPTDYRLDTQLLALQQNFLKKPSELEVNIKVVLSHLATNQVIASYLFKERIPCSKDTPYGGVVAANLATKHFTADLAAFIVRHVKQNS